MGVLLDAAPETVLDGPSWVLPAGIALLVVGVVVIVLVVITRRNR